MKDCLILAETESTNQVAEELAREGAVHGMAVLAHVQRAGRGRLGRSWSSPPGAGLYMSLVLRPHLELAELPRLTLTVGVAVAEALGRLGVAIELKWPNDLYLQARKCGGILLEASPTSLPDGQRYVIAGIGLNLSGAAELPASVAQGAASLDQAPDWPGLDPEALLQLLRPAILSWCARLEAGDWQAVRDGFADRDFLLGRTCRGFWLAYRSADCLRPCGTCRIVSSWGLGGCAWYPCFVGDA